MRGLQTYIAEVTGHKRARPGKDLLSSLVAAHEDGTLSVEELDSMVFQLLVAGQEPVTNQISTALMTLLRRPAHLARLRDNPALLPSVVELQIALGTLLSRLPGLRFAVEPDEIAWIPAVLARGVNNLPVDYDRRQRRCRERAYGVIQRSNAWSTLISRCFPRSVRLSIHPQPADSPKFGIRLLKITDMWTTPWHSCVLAYPDGTHELMPHHRARRLGTVVHRNGRPSHYAAARTRDGQEWVGQRHQRRTSRACRADRPTPTEEDQDDRLSGNDCAGQSRRAGTPPDPGFPGRRARL